MAYVLVFGLMTGLFYLFSEDFEYAASGWQFHLGLIAVVSAIGAFIHWNGTDTLWHALVNDYPGYSVADKSLPSSEGLLISTHFDDKSSAVSFVTQEGIHLQRTGSRRNQWQWATIPWEKISSILVTEPVEGYPVARLDLVRTTNKLALGIPWNRAFDRSVPSSISFTPNWLETE